MTDDPSMMVFNHIGISWWLLIWKFVEENQSIIFSNKYKSVDFVHPHMGVGVFCTVGCILEIRAWSCQLNILLHVRQFIHHVSLSFSRGFTPHDPGMSLGSVDVGT
jgi:hypothetical protein